MDEKVELHVRGGSPAEVGVRQRQRDLRRGSGGFQETAEDLVKLCSRATWSLMMAVAEVWYRGPLRTKTSTRSAVDRPAMECAVVCWLNEMRRIPRMRRSANVELVWKRTVETSKSTSTSRSENKGRAQRKASSCCLEIGRSYGRRICRLTSQSPGSDLRPF